MSLRFDGTKAMREAQRVSTADDKKRGRQEYSCVDSDLDDFDDGSWRETAYINTFHHVIDDYNSIKDYVEIVLEKKRGKAVGIDFGGLGINVFKGFTPGFFEKSIGVSLSDHRTNNGRLYRIDKKIYDDGREHKIIIGNIFDTKVYKKIDKILQGKKVDFIVERMYAGLQNVPENLMVVMATLQRWYGLLDDGGIMLVELPSFVAPIMKRWLELLNKDNKVEVAFDEFRLALRINKLPGAPKQLPKLELKEIKKIFQEYNRHLDEYIQRN